MSKPGGLGLGSFAPHVVEGLFGFSGTKGRRLVVLRQSEE